jgi:dolichol-phosphate mannosyltransferase
MNISIVVPSYNEHENIIKLISELKREMNKIHDIHSFEILVIDDHSMDKTFEVVEKIREKNIRVVRLSRRFGSHIALRAGLSLAKGDVILCLSADGQDDPRVLSEMIKKISNGKDIVWALRTNRDEPFWQRVCAKLFYKVLFWFTENTDPKINLANADFYMLDRKVVDAINSCSERNTSLFGLIVWLGFAQDFVKYERRARFSGESKWNMRGRLRLAIDWIIAFSGVPIKIISFLGIFIAGIGGLYAIFIFFYAILGYSKPGWAEVVMWILIMGGMQMIMLGVIGEYLWRTMDETRKRPLFVIEKTTDINSI